MAEAVNIPDLVKRLRKHLGMTQEQFARELGVTFATINSWENGKRMPQPYLRNRLLEIETSLRKKQPRTLGQEGR